MENAKFERGQEPAVSKKIVLTAVGSVLILFSALALYLFVL